MADEKVKDDDELSKKCAQTGTTLKRAKRYYRNGRYYINKNAFKEHIKTLEVELDKTKEAEKSAEPVAEKPAEAPPKEAEVKNEAKAPEPKKDASAKGEEAKAEESTKKTES